MPVLLELETDRWRLELAGPKRELPSILPAVGSVLTLQGDAQIRVAGEIAGPGTWEGTDFPIRPLLFENTSYDCYLVSKSDGITLELPQVPAGCGVAASSRTILCPLGMMWVGRS